jgi:hypothetical protein
VALLRCAKPNVTPGLLALLRQRLDIEVSDQDVMAYMAGVIGHAGFTRRFGDELQQPGVRVPVTAAAQLWREAVEAGQRVIWLHTFGERFDDAAKGRPPGQLLAGRPDVQVPVPGRPDDMPDTITYDRATCSLVLGSGRAGRIGPVSPAAAAYEVSGMRIVQHWFDYRKRNVRGQRDEPDRNDKMADQWTLAMTEQLRDLIAVLEGCAALEESQTHLLDRITAGPLITTADLEEAGVVPPPDYARRCVPGVGSPALF